MRGIARNGLAAYRGTLERTYLESPDGLLKSSAQSALETLGIDLPEEGSQEEGNHEGDTSDQPEG